MITPYLPLRVNLDPSLLSSPLPYRVSVSQSHDMGKSNRFLVKVQNRYLHKKPRKIATAKFTAYMASHVGLTVTQDGKPVFGPRKLEIVGKYREGVPEPTVGKHYFGYMVTPNDTYELHRTFSQFEYHYDEVLDVKKNRKIFSKRYVKSVLASFGKTVK